MISGIGASPKLSSSPSEFCGRSRTGIESVAVAADADGSDFQGLKRMARMEFVRVAPARWSEDGIDLGDLVTGAGPEEEGKREVNELSYQDCVLYVTPP